MQSETQPLVIAEFAQLVHDMRRYQREFFRTRDKNAIIKSKILERKVDEALDQFFNRQPKLF